MLELKKVTKVYETNPQAKVTALSEVSIAFRRCEFVSVLGPSGCGKTTMLNIIGGLDRYTSGETVVDGKSTLLFTDRDWDTYRNHKIGFVFQSYNLITHQSVLANVELALTLSGVSAIERKRLAMKALERVGLANHLHKKPNELSGGEMQRVAIARAIVNNPEIILADEPTGALDSKTSVQIMDLLKEISNDRLVIMVTHNDQLASAYSTRIIKLLDSKVVYDSRPYVPGTEDEKSAYKSINGTNGGKKTKRGNKNKQQSGNEKEHTSMSFGVALTLSLKNLLTKKARTTLMSVASSIGIVGLALVLALFNGLNVFLDKVQYDTLSAYPMYVTTSTTEDITEYISILTDGSNYISDPNMKDKIFISHLKTKLNSAVIKNKITPAYQKYVENAPQEYVRGITYSYGTSMNIFKKKVVFDTSAYNLTSVPNSIIAEYAKVSTGGYFKEIVGDKDFILSQYDLVAGKYPEEYNELVLVLDKNNRITDTMLVAFLMDINATQKDEEGNFIVNSYSYDTFLGELNPDGTRKESNYGTFTLALNDGLYVENSVGYFEQKYCSMQAELAGTYGDSMASRIVSELKGLGVSLPNCYSGSPKATVDLKIVGILRLNESTTTGALGAYPIGYTSALTEFARKQAAQSNVVAAQKEQYQYLTDGDESTVCKNVLLKTNGTTNSNITSESGYTSALKTLGYAEIPTRIDFYATSFEGKMALKEYLAKFNDLSTTAEEDKVYVTDMVSAIIDVLKTFIDTITYILIALTGISLVVAAIMIAIITYVSVIERTREIGILRSIGARKIDVMSVFNAETIIIGVFSGLLGILFAVLLQLPLNALLFNYTGISSLAVLSPVHGLVLVIVSVIVTLLSGMIPALMASKRDPVKALRSE